MGLFLGFILVIILGLVIYFGGAMIVARMQKAKANDEQSHRFEDKEPAQHELVQQFAQNRAQERAEQQKSEPEKASLPPL
jgi:Na+-transporting methylmalonyl-CoA/oxaloacetate decarboxylase gamma subunit